MGVSDFEGGGGMAAVFGFGPLGGLFGLIGGIWLGLRIGGRQPIGKALRNAGNALLAIVAIAAAGLAIQGAGASLEFELRPVGFALPADPGAIEVTLDTDLNQQSATRHDPALRREGAWQILSGTTELYFRTSRRLLVLRFPDGRDRIFQPRLAAKPDPDQAWSDWRPVDYVSPPTSPRRRDPAPRTRSSSATACACWAANRRRGGHEGRRPVHFCAVCLPTDAQLGKRVADRLEGRLER